MKTNKRPLHYVTYFLILALLTYSNVRAASTSKKLLTQTVTQSKRVAAASSTAQSNPACQNIAPFYWEIGNVTGTLASGKTGDGSITRTTVLSIASATKWLFAAYVAEVRNRAVTTNDIKHLTMSSGYTSFGPRSCSGLSNSATVEHCFNIGNNSLYSDSYLGMFYYNNGHFQKWAVDNGLRDMNSTDLSNEFRTVLSLDTNFSFSSPQLGGGGQASAETYARFLVRILKNQLHIRSLLGTDAVCTLPGTCLTAASSPLPEEFQYSLGHWVESDPTNGDGSFSSAGLFGFYPWIDATKTYYGIVSRHELSGGGGGEVGAAWSSIQCGRLIRKAFLSGKVL